MNEPAWALPGSVETPAGEGPCLVGGQCGDCTLKLYPITPVCPGCWSKNMTRVRLARRGKLYTYTIVHTGRAGWQTPYALGYVDLDDGVRVCAPLDMSLERPIPIGAMVELSTGPLRTDEKGVTYLSHRFKAAPEGTGTDGARS